MSKVNFIKLPFRDTAFEIYSKICKRYSHAYLLESMEGPKKLAQFSFIGFKPRLTVTSKDNTVITRDMETGVETQTTGEPLKAIRAAVGDQTVNSDRFRLTGGAVGYISYDAIRNWEQIPDNSTDDLEFPDIEMGIYDDGIVFDHRKGEGYYYYTNSYRLDEVLRLLKESADYEPLSPGTPTTNMKASIFPSFNAFTASSISKCSAVISFLGSMPTEFNNRCAMISVPLPGKPVETRFPFRSTSLSIPLSSKVTICILLGYKKTRARTGSFLLNFPFPS